MMIISSMNAHFSKPHLILQQCTLLALSVCNNYRLPSDSKSTERPRLLLSTKPAEVTGPQYQPEWHITPLPAPLPADNIRPHPVCS